MIYPQFWSSRMSSRMTPKLVLVCVVLAYCTSVGETSTLTDDDSNVLTASDDFPYYAKLDSNYELQWKFNSTHIVFKTYVKTTGYIGLGISKNGGMYPADVVLAWVKDGQVYVSDRHTIGYSVPLMDGQQDWFLIDGDQKDGYTTITMVRKLNTCDSNDIAITKGTTRIIFAYNDLDPDIEFDEGVKYHGLNRGTISLLLLQPTFNLREQIKLPNDTFTLDILKRNNSIPPKLTTYSCHHLKLPKLDGKHHIIRFEPVIQKGHEKLVHHMALYYCVSPPPQEYMDINFECYTPNTKPSLDNACYSLFLVWANGGTSFDFPTDVGHPLGGPGDPTFFKLEIHYNNPQLRDDFVDNSGLRFYLTKQLRKYDSGLLNVGKAVNDFQIIPPHAPHFLSRGYCTEGCLTSALGDNKIYIFADMLHVHLLGTEIRTRHLRKGVELEPIMEDANYDFNFQETRHLYEERMVQKGDTLFTDCYYDSTNKTSVTFGGLGTDHEMCMSFLLYYPRIRMTKCLSMSVPGNTISEARKVFQLIQAVNYTQKISRDLLAQGLTESNIMPICDIQNVVHGQVVPQPNITHPYVPIDQCPGIQ